MFRKSSGVVDRDPEILALEANMYDITLLQCREPGPRHVDFFRGGELCIGC